MIRPATSDARAQLGRDNQRYGAHLERITNWLGKDEPQRPGKSKVQEVWRSRKFLVVLYAEPTGFLRLTVNRSVLNPDGTWKDGITWDEMMTLKREAGFGDRWCVEAYPADADVVNVANMRHLWLLPARPAWAWSKGER